ncbi:DNA repair protein [Tothia fuscella]|uniref:DNA repair protein REV1 n=1 Tax=Tothia fuscella TaxID=1048955 RepID=A0A9P4U3Z3_9PEZI|nr:DNA repair protein [Tothia fuscella]
MGSRLEKKSNDVRKRIESHTFEDEEGSEYRGSRFGGFTDYFRNKKIKLQNLDAELRSQSHDKPQIFRGIVAHVNGYTQPSLNDIHKLIVQCGGGFMQYLDGKTTVTHIIASTLTPKKAIEFKRYRIVKPAWVVESVKAGRLLPWDSFRVLDEGAGQRVIGFDKGKVVNQASGISKGYKEQTDNSWYTSQLKAGSGIQTPSRTPFLSQRAIPQDLEIEDEINDLPPSTQPIPALSSSEDSGSQSRVLPSSSHSSPPPQQTPQLLRDLRSFRDLDPHEDDEEREESPTPQARPDGREREPAYLALVADDNNAADEINALADIPGISAIPPVDGFKLPNVEQQSLKRPIEGDSESPTKRQKPMTAEEHNEILLADPRVRKSSVVNPEFLEQYYRESRLHHLSAWKADLKSQLQAMAEEKSLSQKMRQKRPAGARRYILHVDFDSFFAAVSLKKHPQYKDKPVAVAHGNGSSGGNGSEIASCNYPARKFGVKNGMWMKRAQELCPELKVLPYDFPEYEKASTEFYEAIIAIGGIIQSVSVDEALVDISTLCFTAAATDGIKRAEGSVYREEEAADNIALKLRDEVKRKTDCNVSIGIGGNILLAKVALRKAKPAGQYHVRPEEVLDFVGKLEVTDLPGVAYSIGGKLEEIGIKFVKDIREVSKEKLITTLGPKTGEKLWEYARGIDKKEVGDTEIRKSVSAEVNWGVRFYNQEQVDEFIESLCGELSRRLIKERVKGRQLSLKLMRKAADAPLDPPKHLGHGKCDSFNKSVLLGVAANGKELLAKESLSMLKSFGFTPGELRGIGIQMTRLEPLKSVAEGQAESSQRRLQFFKKLEPQKEESIEDAPEDPIEEVLTPKKPKAPPDKVIFGAQQLNQSSPSRKPLNTLGTQFILPSQVDPQVLAELPEDIRSKLAQHIKGRLPPSRLAESINKPAAAIVPHSTPKVFTALPAASQLDPDILKSLPEDVRTEILEFYNTSLKKPRANEQAVLPQSPRKNRTVVLPKRPTTSVRRRGRPGKFDVRSRFNDSTLTQSNFIHTRTTRGDGLVTDTDTEADEPDPEFLAALPEDIRREVVLEQRRVRLQKSAGLQVQQRKKKGPLPRGKEPPRVIKLEARPPRPTFTARKLSKLPELRDAISEWVTEFKDDGPYEEDTVALGRYLGRVVSEEGDMNKAVQAVKWLIWVLEEDVDEDAKGKWKEPLEVVKDAVRTAVKGRGLGAIDFG